MLGIRVLPCLLMQDAGLYKTTGFRKPVYVGDPVNTIKIFNVKEVDELILLDIGASKKNHAPNIRKIEEIASECFMPMCYGGGIRSLEDADRVFGVGVEKVSLQTGALDNLKLIEQGASKYGTSSVTVSCDLKKSWRGKYKLYAAAKGKLIKQSWQSYMTDAIDAGAGEIFLNSVERDGLMKGLDLDPIREAAALISVPLIAGGGIGSLADIKAGADAGASAISAGAFFVFHGPHRAVLISYPKYSTLKDLLGQSAPQ
jgi:imidazole glycerol-phosphate synthase subunit HisF